MQFGRTGTHHPVQVIHAGTVEGPLIHDNIVQLGPNNKSKEKKKIITSILWEFGNTVPKNVNFIQINKLTLIRLMLGKANISPVEYGVLVEERWQ